MEIRYCSMIVLSIFMKLGMLHSQSPFSLDWKREVALLSIGTGSFAFGQLTNSNIHPLTSNDIVSLNPNSIHPFDRSAVNHHDAWAADMSNIGVYSLMASPLLLFINKKTQKDWQTILLMYAETLGLGATLPNWTKNSMQRIRPYVYNPDVPMNTKMEVDAQRSFFSSHTSVAFSSAVFLSTVYATYFPKSKWRPLVWTGSLVAASTVGFTRYQSGNHFPSDILVGAAVGSSIGYLIPLLHKKGTEQKLSILPYSYTQNIGIQLTYKP